MSSEAPVLVLQKQDGSLLTRIEAEKELWDKCKTSHAMRRYAWGQLRLDSRYAWMLKPTSVTHWILDELHRKRLIAGDPIGVQPELESDDSYFNSFIQRLGVFVQEGRALPPKEGEGIDMSDFQHQMPPAPNGQQQPQQGYAPPPPPPMGFPPPGAQAGPPPQQGFNQAPPPQQQFAQAPQQPQQPQYTAPPQAQGFGPPPGQPQFGGQASFGPPPGQPAFPPQGPPPPVAPPQLPPQGQPAAPAAAAPSDRRPRKSAASAGPPPGAQQQMPFGQPAQQPQGFGAPPVVSGFGAPQGAPQQALASNEIAELKAQVSKLEATIAQLAQQVALILHKTVGIDAAVSIGVRGYYSQPLPGTVEQLSTEATFKECRLPYPPQ
jgi:hypothetical protein